MGYELSEEEAKKAYVEVSGRKGFGVKADDLIDKLEAATLAEVQKRHAEMSEPEQTATAHEIAVGALGLAMLSHLTGGLWGIVPRRFHEAAARTFPALAVGFVPIALGAGSLYLWARPEAVAEDALLQAKAAYLNVPFFLLRAALYFTG